MEALNTDLTGAGPRPIGSRAGRHADLAAATPGEINRRLVRTTMLIFLVIVAALPFVPTPATFDISRGEPIPLFWTDDALVRLEPLVSIPLTAALAIVLAAPALVYATVLGITRINSAGMLERGPYFARHSAFVAGSALLYTVLSSLTVSDRALALVFAAGIVVLTGVFAAIISFAPRRDGRIPALAPAIGTAIMSIPWIALGAEIVAWGPGMFGYAAFVAIAPVIAAIAVVSLGQLRKAETADTARLRSRLHVLTDAAMLVLAVWLTLLIASA